MRVHRRRDALRVVLVAVVLAYGATILGAQAVQKPAATGAKPTFDELYSRGQKINAGIMTLTARFTERTTSSLLASAIEERGTLYVQRPNRVLMRYEEPAGKVVLIDNGRMTLVVPSSGSAKELRQTMDVRSSQKRVDDLFKQQDAGNLRRVFDIQVKDKSERPGTYEVTLAPKRRQIKENLSLLELWAPESTGLLEAMRMTFANGQTKLLEFRDIVTNPPIDSAIFSVPK
jgi:outer membrane lipoprotein-sorting protein